MQLNNDSIREMEAHSIFAFVDSVTFEGHVLDFGCGKQPYRELVERSATYKGYDHPAHPASVISESDYHGTLGRGLIGGDDPLKVWFDRKDWDMILCTQMVQYVENVGALFGRFHQALRENGALVLTYPTTWAEIEQEDLHRFTHAGMERLLKDAGFSIERHDRRGELDLGGFRLWLGGAVVARA